MTFEKWYKHFLHQVGTPKNDEQASMSRLFMKTAWTAGHTQGMKDMTGGRIQRQPDGDKEDKP